MIRWLDLHTDLQNAIISGNFPLTGTSNGRIKFNDLDASLKANVNVRNYMGQTSKGRVKFHDLHSSLQATLISADGYASSTGTAIGGAGGSIVTATNNSEFDAAVGDDTPKIVIVSGTYNIGYTLIGANKTIIGAVGSAVTGTLRIQDTSNVIIRNIDINAPAISSVDQDAIAISNSTNVWIHHCTIHDWTDGGCDITNASDFVTVSWNKFYFGTDYVHSLASLVGSSSGATGDTGKLHCTFHHNYWAENLRDRMPRVRFGRLHCYNDYYHSLPAGALIDHVSAYITTAIDAEILVENGYFESGEDPFYVYPSENGKIKQNGCYIDASVTGSTTATDTVFTPPYSYSLQSPSDARIDILAYAGAIVPV